MKLRAGGCLGNRVRRSRYEGLPGVLCRARESAEDAETDTSRRPALCPDDVDMGWKGADMIVSVASGKGGTGKTTVAVNLALVLARSHGVQFIDADVEEPNAAIFLKPDLTDSQEITVAIPSVDREKCTYCGHCSRVCAFNAIVVGKQAVVVLPELCHGCGGCTLLCPEGAIEEVEWPVGSLEWGVAHGMDFAHGRLQIGQVLAPPIITELRRRARPGGVLIVDASPGTSCTMVTAIRGSDFCLLVTEPTPFGYNDLRLAVEVTRKMGIPVGVVVNRADIGDDRVEEYLAQENLPLLAKLPFDRDLARAYASGELACLTLPTWEKRFSELAEQLECVAGIAERTET